MRWTQKFKLISTQKLFLGQIVESLDRASEWAVRAAAMEDATGEAHIILAHVKLLRGHHDEAETIAEEAVRIRPQCANTNALSANILVYCGKPVKAIEHVKAAIRHAPAYASWWVEILAAAYRDSGQSDMAVALLGAVAALLLLSGVHDKQLKNMVVSP